jgi:2-polyprenyl-3-methyl-5-hydroxy-6-metoxy-1,4-benzoquinol methylase
MASHYGERALSLWRAARGRLGLDGDQGLGALRSSQRAWERLARKDPLWAVLTDPRKRGRAWQEDEFFATGTREIATLFGYLEGRGIAPADHRLALDFGCGVGRLSRALATRFDEVHGVDASPTMIERARGLNAQAPGKMTFILNQAPDLAQLPSARYSFIYSNIVLQHIPYPASLTYVREFMRLVRPGGLVVFQTPTLDRTGLALRALRTVARRVAQGIRLPIDALHIEMHVIPEAVVRSEAAGAGCEVLDVAYTNAVNDDLNGQLEFFAQDRGDRLVSQQFALRRR